jgi:short-subunit dehydrogenase
MKTIAIFGAGPALGMAVARRFGREGFQVALVARDPGRLDEMVKTLDASDVAASAFLADLNEPAAALRAADEIEQRLGPIDVLEYSPTGNGGDLRKSPTEVDVATMGPLLDKYILTPVALVGRVLPGMLERGEGSLLFALGAAGKYPTPRLASAGIAVSGLRNYVHTLHAELTPSNIYAGAMLIGALIEGSNAHREASAWSNGQVPVVAAEDLAEHYWDMHIKRDRVEEEVTPGL